MAVLNSIRSTAVLICVIAFGTPLALADSRFEYGGHTYDIVTGNKTWSDAALDAVSRAVAGINGYLVTIESAEENATLFQSLLNVVPSSDFNQTRAPDGGNGVYVWIGATDRVNEGDWLWDGDGDNLGVSFWQGTGSAGTSIDGAYQNWGHLPTEPTRQWEPDNAAGGLQDAAGIGLANW
ncbi:MAG: hypothetical protein KDB23_24515, partial [Planctomycetales bacterium]|nr:hypothetical protein [Planctomycetales bacterium]